MELALTIFAGLVLFAAFGKPVAKGLQAISPSLPGALGKLIRLIPWITTPGIALFAYLILAEQKTWDDGQRFLLILGAGALIFVARFLCTFVADVLQAVDPVIQVVGRGIFAEEEARESSKAKADQEPDSKPKQKAKAKAERELAFSLEDEEEDATWSVSFDDMKARVEMERDGEPLLMIYVIKRDKEGEWFAREARKGSEWEPLEDISERLASVIETRWRKMVS